MGQNTRRSRHASGKAPPLRQYEIRWAVLPPPAGRRPVLLLSRNAALETLNLVLIAELTTTIRGIPQEVLLGRREGLASRSVANLDTLSTVARRRIEGRLGALGPARELEVKRALGYVLGWPELKVLGDPQA